MIEVKNKKLCESCFGEVEEKGKCPHCGFSKEEFEPDALVLPMGTKLQDKILIGRVIGKGGFGITYLGYDMRMERVIAVKEYYPNGIAYRSQSGTEVLVANANTQEAFENGTEKFYAEAEMVAQFNGNPNIVGVYDYFRENNTVYLIMEYLNGVTLKNYVKRHGRINDGQALFLMDKMAAALSITHSAGVLHRDISPDNIMICLDGKVKLIDFGAARRIVAESSSNLTVVLKPGYTPIEQYTKKGRQGAWTDIHALGASIYYAMTGKVLDDPYERMENDPEFETNLHGINDTLWNVIKKSTMINAQDRYGNAIELRKALAGVSAPLKAEPIVLDSEDMKPGESEKSETKSVLTEREKPESSQPIELFAGTQTGGSEDYAHPAAESADGDPADKAYKRTDGKKSPKKLIFGIVGALAAVAAVIALVVFLSQVTGGTNGITIEIDSEFPGNWEPSSRAITPEDLSQFEGDVKVTLNVEFVDDDGVKEYWANGDTVYHHHLQIRELTGDVLDVYAFNKGRDEFGTSYYLGYYQGEHTEDSPYHKFEFVIPHDLLYNIPRGIYFTGSNLYVISAVLEDYDLSAYAPREDAMVMDIAVDYFDNAYSTEFSQFITKRRLQSVSSGDVRITFSIEPEYISSNGDICINPFGIDGNIVELECVNQFPNKHWDGFNFGYYATAPDTVAFVISAKQIEALADEGIHFGINNGHLLRAYLEPA